MEDWNYGYADGLQEKHFPVILQSLLQREIFRRSSIVGFIVNKQITESYNDTLFNASRFNRVAGLEYNFATEDNQCRVKFSITSQSIRDRTKMLQRFRETSAIPLSI